MMTRGRKGWLRFLKKKRLAGDSVRGQLYLGSEDEMRQMSAFKGPAKWPITAMRNLSGRQFSKVARHCWNKVR